jgi:citrate lyase subunit beta/citryl-CoA lyase
MQLSRSYLYVPADKESVVQKSGSRGADALILDLEDAVAPESKPLAREILASTLESGIEAAGELWVRINPPSLERGAMAAADVAAAVSARTVGLVIAKTESAADVEFVRHAVEDASLDRGLEPGAIGLAPILESPTGVDNMREIAHANGVVRLSLGEVDLIAALGLEPDEDEAELLAFRSAIVVASAAAGLGPPAGSVFRDWSDDEGLRRTSLRLRRLGYFGRSVIHPAQIAAVHEVFTPSEADLARAQRVADRYERELAKGNGVYSDEVDGTMVDIAVVRAAWRTLEMGGRGRHVSSL